MANSPIFITLFTQVLGTLTIKMDGALNSSKMVTLIKESGKTATVTAKATWPGKKMAPITMVNGKMV